MLNFRVFDTSLEEMSHFSIVFRGSKFPFLIAFQLLDLLFNPSKKDELRNGHLYRIIPWKVI